MTPINPKTDTLAETLELIHKQGKIPLVIIDEEMYIHEDGSVYLKPIFTPFNGNKYICLKILNIKNLLIYAFPSTKTPYQMVKAGQCMDKYLYKINENSVHDEVGSLLKEGKIVGCIYKSSGINSKRLVDKDGECFDNKGYKRYHFTENYYSDFCYFDSFAKAFEWISS